MVSFNVLNDAMREDYRKRVVKCALDHRAEASPPARQMLVDAISERVKVKGFRDARQAPTSVLHPAVLDATYRSSRLMGAVLRLWVESQEDLWKSLKEFLCSIGVAIEENLDWAGGFSRKGSQEKCEEICTHFHGDHPEFSEDDVILMFWCLTGKAYIDGEEENELESESTDMQNESEVPEVEGHEQTEALGQGGKMNQSRWALWLEELQSLPPEAAEWETVKSFMQDVESLAAQKQEELKTHKEFEDRRTSLQAELTALLDQSAEYRDYFGLKNISSWETGMCLYEDLARVSELVYRLRESITKYRQLSHTPQRSFAEETNIGKEIIDGYHQLDSLLSSTDAQKIGKIDVKLQESAASTQSLDVEGTPASGEMLLDHHIPQAESLDEQPHEEHVAGQAMESASLQELKEEAQPQTVERVFSVPPLEPAGIESEIAAKATTTAEPAKTQIVTDNEIADEQTASDRDFRQDLVHIEGIGPDHASIDGVRAKRDAAMLVSQHDGTKEWNALLSTFIYQNDLCGAYWLSSSLRVSELNPFVPDWMVKAVLGSQWLSHDSFSFVDDLLEIAKNHQPESDDVQILMGLAAALNSTLIAPVTGLVGWLKVPGCCVGLRTLVKAVQDFSKLPIALRPEDLLGVAGKEQREMALRDKVSEAERWLDGASVRRTSYRMATDVWRHLVSSNGGLCDLLGSVTRDQRDGADQVRQNIDKWSQHEYAIEQFDQIARSIRGAKAPTIVGAPRQHLLNGINEACSIARGWCDLVAREREIQSRGDWVFQQVTQLRAKAQEHLEDVDVSLNELLNATSLEHRAAAACMVHSLWKLQVLLQIPRSQIHLEADESSTWDWLKMGSIKIDEPLNRRLLYLSGISLDDDGRPYPEGLNTIAPALKAECLSDQSLRGIVEQWLEKQDYRFARMLIDQLQDDTVRSDTTKRYHELLKGSQLTLRERLAGVDTAIEQAVVDGIISDSEGRSEYSAAISKIIPDEILNFPPRYAELSRIQIDLQKARQDRVSQLKEDWLILQERLLTSHMDAARCDMVRGFVDSAMLDENTGVVEECLAHLKEVLDTGVELEDRLFSVSSPREERDELREFKSLWSPIEESLEIPGRTLQDLAGKIVDGRTFASMKFAEVPKKRREEASSAILAWQKLKQQKLKGRAEELVQDVLRYLGFSVGSGLGKTVVEAKRGPDWTYFRAAISISDLAKPIPQFGSQARGRYDLICLWERPGFDSIAARIRELNLNLGSVLVFYLGRMTERQRRDMVRICREKELAIALLDETLLVFLAQERDARFPVFLRLALPFAALNPYTPFQAGDVPTEMFFGRSAMSRELQRATGSCLVYGGRQLGKSALLRHVQRLFDNADRDQYAWIENTKLVFDPQAGKNTNNIWRGLREAFKGRDLLSSRKTSDKPEEIRRYLREAMEAESRRVLVMFDEADDFLDADANDNFRVVTALRELMLETERRFKVIFAGLHNVQRFQGIPDQPLAHFGAPLCVGPLEPAAARQLVLAPLTTLGYRLNNATVLRILSYTNYHPGLIQLFCQEILKRLHTNSKNALPPYEVQQSDVEAVYRIEEVRQRIRERFDWTLALDSRYQAIAWAMIENQMQAKDSYALPYTPADILKLASSWWPQGFRSVNMDKLRSLLDEMCGLGVLVRNSQGYYRLRSPNLVRLMGTDTDIYSRLEEMMDKQPPTPFTADSYHTHLDQKAEHYSPLTHSQARSLNLPKFGVGMIFASEAMGFSYLPKALDRFVAPEAMQVEHCTEVPGPPVGDQEFRKWLGEHIQVNSQYERLIVHLKMARHSFEIQRDLVLEAVDFCRRHQKSRKQWVRVIFLFDAAATMTWLSQSHEVRDSFENSVDAIVIPQRWDAIAIRQRLEQHQKMHSDKICNRILEVTGGWPFLLDHLFKLSEVNDDPGPRIDEVEHQLLQEQSSLGEQFYGLLGIQDNSNALQILNFMTQEPEVPLDLIEEPDLVPSVSKDECKQAVEYLLRMNCLELKEEVLSVEATVKRVVERRC